MWMAPPGRNGPSMRCRSTTFSADNAPQTTRDPGEQQLLQIGVPRVAVPTGEMAPKEIRIHHNWVADRLVKEVKQWYEMRFRYQ
jgi:hypothetical protein